MAICDEIVVPPFFQKRQRAGRTGTGKGQHGQVAAAAEREKRERERGREEG